MISVLVCQLLSASLLVFLPAGVMRLLLALVPFIPGLRSIPRWTRIYRLIWRNHYREVEGGPGGSGSSGGPPRAWARERAPRAEG